MDTTTRAGPGAGYARGYTTDESSELVLGPEAGGGEGELTTLAAGGAAAMEKLPASRLSRFRGASRGLLDVR